MQRTVYFCDYGKCKKEIGKVPHVTLAIGSNGVATGIAIPNPNGGWSVKGFPHNFLHLHIKCTQLFFQEQLDRSTKK